MTPYLRSLTAHWSKGGSDGEDILQDILLTLHSVRQTYDPSRSFEQWLVGVAKHRVNNCWRQNRHRRPIAAARSLIRNAGFYRQSKGRLFR
ncbi:MAG: sigma factor [Bradyrhizobium sp.]